MSLVIIGMFLEYQRPASFALLTEVLATPLEVVGSGVD